MKEKIHYAIEAALAVAIIIVFVLHFKGNKDTSKTSMAISDTGNASGMMSIAYVDIDSLTSNYTYSIDLNEHMAKKFENSRAKFAEQMRKVQVEADDFQRKYETNSFLSQERAQTALNNLRKKQEDLQKLEAQYAQELDDERLRLTNALRNTIVTQVDEYNKSKGFHIVFSKRDDNILFANDAYNITAEVTEFLNRHYAASPVLKPE